MALIRNEIRDMAARGSPFSDRLSGRLNPINTPPVMIDRRIQRWRAIVDKGAEGHFEKRLARYRLDASSIRPLLGKMQWPDHLPLPAWTGIIEEAVSLFEKSINPDVYDASDKNAATSSDEVEYRVFLDPFVILARKRLEAASDLIGKRLMPSARFGLEEMLISRLNQFIRPTLQLEWSAFAAKSNIEPMAGPAFIQNGSSSKPGLSRAFMIFMSEGGFAGLMHEYAVLARLMATTVQSWVKACTTMVERLENDYGELCDMYDATAAPGRVSKVRKSRLAAIQPGQPSLMLTFETGHQYDYIPQPRGADALWNNMLTWCSSRYAPIHIYRPRVINRAQYGWVESPETSLEDRKNAWASYYTSWGGFICLVYVMCGEAVRSDQTGIHSGYPVLLDASSILSADQSTGAGVSAPISGSVESSILQTGLIPEWHSDGDDVISEHKGRRPANLDDEKTGGRLSTACEYRNEVLDGFDKMYRFFMKHRDALVRDWGNLSDNASENRSVVVRNPALYQALLDQSCEPSFLRDAADRRIAFDVLCRAGDQEHDPRMWRRIEAEIAGLEAHEHPIFLRSAGRRGFYSSNKAVDIENEGMSDAERVYARIAQISESDRKRQTALLRLGLTRPFSTHSINKTAPPGTMHENESMSGPEYMAAATRIAESLKESAIPCRADGVAWLMLDRNSRTKLYRLTPYGYNLYSGTLGIGLFLSALECETGCGEYNELIEGIFKPIQNMVCNRIPMTSPYDEWKNSGMAGLGGLVYGLARMSRFLNRSDMLDAAVSVAALFSAEKISQDTSHEFIYGHAGAIPGLLLLHQMTADENHLESAVLTGQHLLASSEMIDERRRGWHRPQAIPQVGFSHGAAGIAYALLRLFATTKDNSFRDAALEGIAFENSFFSREKQNWPDLKRNGSRLYPVQWCRGAAGIGLSRLGILNTVNTPEIRQDIDRAVHAVLSYQDRGTDHLCCGLFGRAGFLLDAGQRLKRPDFTEAARRIGTISLSRADRDGGFRLPQPDQNEVFQPTLFRGVAGIGYELIRLAHPDRRIPSVLMMD